MLFPVPEDSLKYRTAVFLIENMPGPYYYEGEDLEDYLEFYPLLYDTMRKGHLPVDAVAEIQKKYGYLGVNRLQRREDIQTVDSAYLCENIEWAFKVREEQPWGKNVSFEDFCRYILPYRVGDETLPVWREKYYREFNPILDSLRESTGTEKEDGLTESSFFYRKGYGGWAGLDFGKRVRVDKIIYSPRNWDNYIKPGCDLEISRYITRRSRLACFPGCPGRSTVYFPTLSHFRNIPVLLPCRYLQWRILNCRQAAVYFVYPHRKKFVGH